MKTTIENIEAKKIVEAIKRDSFKVQYDPKTQTITTTAWKEYAEYILVDAGIIPEPKRYGNISHEINGIKIVYGDDD